MESRQDLAAGVLAQPPQSKQQELSHKLNALISNKLEELSRMHLEVIDIKLEELSRRFTKTTDDMLEELSRRFTKTADGMLDALCRRFGKIVDTKFEELSRGLDVKTDSRLEELTREFNKTADIKLGEQIELLQHVFSLEFAKGEVLGRSILCYAVRIEKAVLELQTLKRPVRGTTRRSTTNGQAGSAAVPGHGIDWPKVQNSMLYCRAMWATSEEFRHEFGGGDDAAKKARIQSILDADDSVAKKDNAAARLIAEGLIIWKKILVIEQKKIVRDRYEAWKDRAVSDNMEAPLAMDIGPDPVAGTIDDPGSCLDASPDIEPDDVDAVLDAAQDAGQGIGPGPS